MVCWAHPRYLLRVCLAIGKIVKGPFITHRRDPGDSGQGSLCSMGQRQLTPLSKALGKAFSFPLLQGFSMQRSVWKSGQASGNTMA